MNQVMARTCLLVVKVCAYIQTVCKYLGGNNQIVNNRRDVVKNVIKNQWLQNICHEETAKWPLGYKVHKN